MATARVDRGAHRRRRTSASGSAPRINAAGRLCHPGEALELLLTDRRAARAGRSRRRLEGLNRERQAVEDTILHEAVDQLEARRGVAAPPAPMCWPRRTGTRA